MLGNDIVDLAKARLESNWQRKGYLNKIFTTQEQEEIWIAPNPETTVWLLWSMKEAAYKIVNRASLERFYSPKKFICKFNGNDGLVNFENQTFFTKSEVKDNLIHTIATTKSDNLVYIKTSYLANTKDYVDDFNSKSKQYILVKDENRIPHLVDKNNGKVHFASVSHHGEYLAVVCGV